MENGKQPINPQMFTRNGDGDNDFEPLRDGNRTGYEKKFGGLTKREYFAGIAMQGLISGRWACPDNVPNDVNTIVNEAILHADELLKKLEEK